MGMQDSVNKKENKAHRIPYPKRLHTIKEASAYIGLPVWAIRTLIWNGFPHIKNGHTFYLDIKDMDDYIEQQKVRCV
jgi:hypothetical protein